MNRENIEGLIKQLKEEQENLQNIIDEGANKLRKREKISRAERNAIADADERIEEINISLEKLKNYKSVYLPITECINNESFGLDDLEKLQKLLSKESKIYEKKVKEVVGLKSNASINTYLDKQSDEIAKLLEDITKAISNGDIELENNLRIDYENKKKNLKDVKEILHQDYFQKIDELINDSKDKASINPELISVIESHNEKMAMNETKEINMTEPEMKDKSSLKDKVLGIVGFESGKEELASEIDDELDNLNQIEEKQNKGIKKKIIAGVVGVAVLVGGLVYGLNSCETKDKKVENKPEKETEEQIELDAERLAYFTEVRDIRESDAKLLTQNAEEISEILESNNVTGIKDNLIDELLADIYAGNNITSSAENYDSYDTYMNMMNQGNIEVYETIREMPGYENSDLTDNAESLEFAKYLDIDNNSNFDKYMTELVDATKAFYNDYNNKEKAQNLIDLIYQHGLLDSGNLTPQEEGIVCKFIMNACGPLQITASMNNMKVTGTDLTVDELFYQVNHIEVITDKDCYTRSLT